MTAVIVRTLILGGLLCLLISNTAQAQRRSGFEDMGASTQAMQRDDAQNPAMLWVQSGAQLFERRPASNAQSCAQCHGASQAGKPPAALQGIAARYPAIDKLLGKPTNLSQRINQCRQRHQSLPALPSEHEDLISLDAWLGFHSRAQPIAPVQDAVMKTWQARGQQLFEQRIGQLNLSCAQCHNERAGLQLAASTIPQAHPTGYPIYRLEWQGMGSLARRLRGCMSGVRAQPYAPWSDEMTALEVYLASRAMGMKVETPAVRP
jgi:L-cysteine S-thiosulfotransferase